MVRRLVWGTAWTAFLVLVLVVLRAAGGGELAAPPLGSLDALSDWAEARSAATAAMALVRLVAEVAAWYLLALTGLHIIGQIFDLRPAHRLADALSVAGSQRVLYVALGLSAAASTQMSGAIQTASPPVMMMQVEASEPDEQSAPDTPTMVVVPDAGAGTATMTPIGDATITPRGTAVARPVPPTAGTASMTPSHDVEGSNPGPGDAEGTARMVPVVASAEESSSDQEREARTRERWTVTEGESFWTIANQIMAEARARPVSAEELDGYWRLLIEANRSRLADPSNPDLIYPGQVFDVPPPA